MCLLSHQFFASNTLPGKKEFISKLTERWDEINNIGKSQTKYEWIDTLGKFGFKDSYFITKTPKILEKFGIINQNIVLSKSNLAYIFSKHVGEYKIESYKKMSEVINDYDILLHGKKGENNFVFYKLYDEGNGKTSGLEIAIDKDKKFEDDKYIVHFNYFGKSGNRALKYYERYINGPNVIDYVKK